MMQQFFQIPLFAEHFLKKQTFTKSSIFPASKEKKTACGFSPSFSDKTRPSQRRKNPQEKAQTSHLRNKYSDKPHPPEKPQ